MKKAVVMIVVILGFVSVAVFAEGGKNCIRHHGDNGQGAVVQHQVKVNN